MEPISVEIIKNAQNGDVEAFQEIYEKTYQHVFSYALKLSKNEADAKDIAQETYIQVYQRESKTGITYRGVTAVDYDCFLRKNQGSISKQFFCTKDVGVFLRKHDCGQCGCRNRDDTVCINQE